MVIGRTIRLTIFVIFVCLIASSPVFSSPISEIKSNELVQIETRPGIKEKFILVKPVDPKASVVLLEGGPGKLDLSSLFGKPMVGNQNVTFLIKNRDDLAKQGLIVAAVDAPSDQQSKRGMELDFRIGNEQAQDIKAIANYLRAQANIPVWVVGISASTLSVPNAVIRLGEGIDGIVLLSSGTKMHKDWPIFKSHPNGILDMELGKVKVPVLIIAHEGDQCDLTPPADAIKIKEALVNSPKAEVVKFSGGASARSDACRELSPHGFYGIEQQVIEAIADFIKANSK
jgi:pimeloyl-ACP methyl ester carboxylesterase